MTEPIEFSGFDDYASPEAMARAVVTTYGRRAEAAARECVDSAFMDDRMNDYVFWLEVVAVLRHEKPRRA